MAQCQSKSEYNMENKLYKKIFKQIISVCTLLLIFWEPVFALSPGEELFMNNKPLEAAPLLEKEIQDGTASVNSYNYLGLSYYQTGNYKRSVEVFQMGLSVPGTNKKILAFNAGNSCYAQKDYKNAIEYFSLALATDKNYGSALLNRANSYLMAENYEKALDDYRQFLVISPEDRQADKIRQMIDALTGEIAALEEQNRRAEEERLRLEEEERKLQEELARLKAEREAEEARLKAEREAEEARLKAEREAEEERRRAEEKARREEEERILAEKRAAEAERRRKLLEEVANSLQETDSTSMTSGTEDLIEYEMESELD